MTEAFIATLFIVPAIFLVFIPIFPALLYMMFLIALIFAVVSGFATLGTGALILLALIALLSVLVGHLSGLFGAKFGGARWMSLGIGILGAFVGFFALGPLGSFIGLLFGIFASEYVFYDKSDDAAFRAAGGFVIGAVTGMIINFILAISFVSLFVFFVFFK